MDFSCLFHIHITCDNKYPISELLTISFNQSENSLHLEIKCFNCKKKYTFQHHYIFQNTLASTCSPLGMQVRPFPSLRKKMNEYMEERQNILNPFAPNREFPNRPVPLPFAKSPNSSQPKEVTQRAGMTLINLEKRR